MNSHHLTSERLTRDHLDRIFALDQKGPGVNSVIQLHPDAIELAENADAMRRHGATTAQFPLLGIPVLLKDNIDTGETECRRPRGRSRSRACRLFRIHHGGQAARRGRRHSGETLNLSEWANFRSTHSTSGWSGRGGLTHSPYSLDCNACGSSSGSGAATAANFTAISFGSETDGSIVCPGA